MLLSRQNNKSISKELGISPRTYYRRLKTANFKMSEMETLIRLLNIPLSQVTEIFSNE